MSARRGRFSLCLAISAVLIAGVVVTAGLVVGGFFERHALAHEEEHTAAAVEHLAQTHVWPTDFLAASDAAAAQRFETTLGDLNGVFRMKVFGAGGRIVWSNERRLIGLAFPDNPHVGRALRGETVTVISRPRRSEHVFERDRGHVAETYVPIRFPGDPTVVGVIEAYRDVSGHVASIRQIQALIWSVATGAGLALWTAIGLIVWSASSSERRTARRLAAQNGELKLLQTFTTSVLKPLTLGDVPASMVATIGVGLGLVGAALFRIDATGEPIVRAAWPAGQGVEPPPPDLLREVLDTRSEAIAGRMAVFAVETATGADHVFVAVFRHAVSDTELPALGTLRIMVAEGAVALTNVELYTGIREAHERLAAILAGVTDRMVIIGADMRVVWMNQAAASALDPSPVVGEACYTIFGGDAQLCEGCPAVRALQTGRVERAVRAQATPASGVRYLDLVAAPLRDGTGRVYQVLEVARDITELVEMEERLKQSAARLEESHAQLVAKADELERANRALRETQAQLVETERLAAVGDVVTGLHHAILNPLAGTLGAFQVLRQQEGLPERTRTALGEAEMELRRIESLVRRLPSLRRTDGTPYVGRTTMLDVERACEGAEGGGEGLEGRTRGGGA